MDRKSFEESLEGMALDEMIVKLASNKLLPIMKCIVLSKIAEQMEMDMLITGEIRNELKRRGWHEDHRTKPSSSTDNEDA